MKEVAKQLKALGNERRLKIIMLLAARSPRSVGELAEALRLSFRSTSKHLQILKHAGFLENEQVGLTVLYRLVRDHSIYRAISSHLK